MQAGYDKPSGLVLRTWANYPLYFHLLYRLCIFE